MSDMTWEQKCRVSALRAACASPYADVEHEDSDDCTVRNRVLERAEVFRLALLSDGPLNSEEHRDNLVLKEREVCPACESGSPDYREVLHVGVGGTFVRCNHKWHVEAAV